MSGRPGPEVIRICIKCGNQFHPKSTRQKCCNQVITTPCVVCGKPVQQICTTKPQPKTCSTECTSKLGNLSRENSAHKLTKICKYCGKEFTPKSARDEYCLGPHYATCEVCGKQFEVTGRYSHINKTCSDECSYILSKRNTDITAMVAQLKETMLKKYGVENAAQLSETKTKAKATTKEKYGVEYYTQTQEYRDRVKTTSLEKYGVEHPLKSDAVKNKRQQTIQRKYHTDNVFQAESIKAKSKHTVREKYGVDFVSQSPEVHSTISKNRKNNVSADGQIFDSSYEKIFYEFLQKTGDHTIERSVPVGFEYQGKSHITLIDFKVDGILFEVKGSHLLTGVYDHVGIPIAVKLDVYRKNHVIVVTDTIADTAALFGPPNSTKSNGLKYLDKCPNPLIGIDINLFTDTPDFPFASDRAHCFYDVRVNDERSAYEAFFDPTLRWKMINNRIMYSGGFIDNKQVLNAMSITRTCKQPSWFSESLAVHIITEYCSQSTIFDLAAGWGARYDACKKLGRTYVACDYNKELVQWYEQSGRSEVCWHDGRTFTCSEPCSIFICPPYSDPKTGKCFEDYNFEGFDESAKSLTQCQWLQVAMDNAPNWVDATMVCKIVDPGWEKYIVETINNRSHFGDNHEYIIHIKREK